MAFVLPKACVAQLPLTRRWMSLTNCSAPKSTMPNERPRSVMSSNWWRIGDDLGMSTEAYLFNSSMKMMIRPGISSSGRSDVPSFRLYTARITSPKTKPCDSSSNLATSITITSFFLIWAILSRRRTPVPNWLVNICWHF